MLWTIRHQLSQRISQFQLLYSNAHDEIRFDFYSQQPVGGPYYASEEPIIDPLTESISALPTPTVLVGIESEFVIQLADARELTTLTNNDVQLSTVVTDLADSSFLAGVSVEFFFDFNGSNVSMGTSQTDANGSANLTWNAAGIAPGAYEILVLVADDLTDPLAKGNSRHLETALLSISPSKEILTLGLIQFQRLSLQVLISML